MQKSKKSEDVSRKINILLFDGFSNLCLANFLEPFRAANTLARQKLYQWRCLTPNGGAVQSSSGISVVPDRGFEDQSGWVLAVMPSYGFSAYQDLDLLKRLGRAAKRHEAIAGLDTGSWLLARSGLLDSYTATIHWEEQTLFAESFPEVDATRERYVLDRDRYTCSGALAAFDLAQALIAQHHGPVLSLEVGEFLLADRQRRSSVAVRGLGRGLVSRAWQLMQANLEPPLSIAELAKSLGCSQKTLETRFRSELATTPSALYRRLRLNQALKLVIETDQSIAEVAGRSGYENASAMTRAFKAEFGVPPQDMRKRPGSFG